MGRGGGKGDWLLSGDCSVFYGFFRLKFFRDFRWLGFWKGFGLIGFVFFFLENRWEYVVFIKLKVFYRSIGVGFMGSLWVNFSGLRGGLCSV